ncbi:hypothetical protein D9613_011123 [Agrocybe pediades]|uniref:F-box domain-containing protein n=1 Tax=Agrocybe pediades TaxID=84607 RepID=A0A8H4VJG9_9AGAR|nr:hypothetical protein D9613_011123 [Agrocybe pediades]
MEPGDTATPTYCYPGGHATGSSNLFLSIYDEEEYYERLALLELSPNALVDPGTELGSATATGINVNMLHFDINRVQASTSVLGLDRPTIYHLLRLFDSITGFHKGYLDLSGRHPERYFDLQSQWNRFLCSLLSLGTEIRIDEVSEAQAKYCIEFNTERWRRFQMKWRLPETTTYSQILKCTQRLLRELKQNPAPFFQTLCLTHLPNEVLDNIFSLASMAQAKALASTCHTLNDIGQRQIFRTWHMKLHVPPHITPFNVEYSSIDLPALAYYCRQDLEKNAQFILSNPHISHRMQRLVLTDEWWVSRRAHSNGNNPFMLGIDFYRSVTQIFASVLKIATRLTTLVLCNLEINFELTRRISEIPTLHTLEMHLCHIPLMVRKKLNIGTDQSFMFPQVANLRIYMDSSFSETHSQWHALLLCPHIRTLSVVQYGVGAFPSPDAMFWAKCRMNNLERLSLDNIDASDLAQLMNFLMNHREAVLHMTHFKLHMDWGVPDPEALDILRAIHLAPLEVLVLEGLADAEFELFDRIAEQFPELIALTLVRRQNRNQHQNKLALWPRPSWEYAQHVRAFKKLKHFCWNFLTEYWDATPVALLAFEADFRTASSSSAGSSSSSASSSSSSLGAAATIDLSKTEEVPYFLDSHWLALPFVAHCPTLETFSLMDRTIDMVCRIERHPITRAVKLVPKYYPTHMMHDCFSTTATMSSPSPSELLSSSTSAAVALSNSPASAYSLSSLAADGSASSPPAVERVEFGWTDVDQVMRWNTTTMSYWPSLLPLSKPRLS